MEQKKKQHDLRDDTGQPGVTPGTKAEFAGSQDHLLPGDGERETNLPAARVGDGGIPKPD